MRGEKGQALLELLAVATLATVVLGGIAAYLRAQWNRSRCAFCTFEVAHARLAGSAPRACAITAALQITVEETDQAVRARGNCGRAREEVELVRLEAARWR